MLSLKPNFQFCWGHGGYLAEIKSEDEENNIDLYLIHGVSYWIGLSDLAEEGKESARFVYLIIYL